MGSELRQKIAELKILHKKSCRTRGQNGQYSYLAEVYGFYRSLRDKNVAQKASKKIAKLFKIKIRNDSHPIGIIIRASLSNQADEFVNRWTQCLRYAWARRRDWDTLDDFFKNNGGIRGCAERFSERNSRKRYVRSN
jgi:hypothetical protein